MVWKQQIKDVATKGGSRPGWKKRLERNYAQSALMAFTAEAERNTGSAAVPDEFGRLQLVDRSNVKHGPTVRAGNIAYIQDAFGLDESTSKGVYESIVATYFPKGKEPSEINLDFVKRRQQDNFLKMSGINPTLWRTAIDFVRNADDSVDWDARIRLVPEESRDEFLSYVIENAIPKDRGFWGKSFEAVKRAGLDIGENFKNWFRYYNLPIELQKPDFPLDADVSSEEFTMATRPQVSTSPEALAKWEKNRETSVFASQAKKSRYANDEIKGDNLLSRGYFGALKMAPAMGTGLSMGPAGIFFWFQQAAVHQFEGMVSSGIDPTIAGNVALIGAIPHAYVERMQVKGLLPEVSKGAEKVVKKTLQKWAAETVKKYGWEFGEEVVQGGIEMVDLALADWFDKNNPEIDYKQEFKDMGEGLMEAALSLPWLMAPGAGIDLASTVDFGGRKQPKADIKNIPQSEKSPQEKPTKPAVKPITNAERLQQIAQAETVLRDMGEFTNNPVADELRQKAEMLKNGASAEEIADLETQYNEVFGGMEQEESLKPGEKRPIDVARQAVRDLEEKQTEDATAMDAEVEEIQRQAITEGKATKSKKNTKQIFTSTPAEWIKEPKLSDWGNKGLRTPGNRKVGKRKTFIWADEYGKIPTRLPKTTMDALKENAGDDFFSVSNFKKGEENYYIFPKKVIKDVISALGEDAFNRKPKPQRSPKQLINDAINSMKRRAELSPAEMGEVVLSLASDFGLTESALSVTQMEYVKDFRNEQESQNIRTDVQAGVDEEVSGDDNYEAEERRAIQEEHLAEEVGDFLEGLDVEDLSNGGTEKQEGKPVKRWLVSEEEFKAAGERLADDEQNRPGKGFRKGSVLGPEQISDLIKRGAYYFETGIRDFAEWSAKMIKEFGEAIKPQLKKIYKQIETEDAQQKYSDKWYEENRDIDFGKTVKEHVSDFGGKVKEYAEFVGTPMSSRLYRIAPFLFRRIRGYLYDSMQQTAEMKKEVMPFLAKLKSMNESDSKDLTFALYNGDTKKTMQIIKAYGISEEFATAKMILDKIFAKAKAVGLEVQYRKGYWPRVLTDTEGFLEFYYGTEDWSIIEKAFEARRKQAGGRALTEQEKSKIVNSLLRGYRIGGMALARPGAAKERSVDTVSQDNVGFYANPAASLLNYIHSMNESIASRKFFGKETEELTKLRAQQSRLRTRLYKLTTRQGNRGWKENTYKTHIADDAKKLSEVTEKIQELTTKDVEQSVGDYVRELVENRDGRGQAITPKQEKEIQGLLTGIFDARGMTGIGKAYANVTYITTLGSPINALTQFKEMALAAYRSPVDFIPAAVRAFLNKSELTAEEIGVTNIGQEQTDAATAKLVANVLKWEGFSKVDLLGKETYINTVLNKYRRDAKSGNTELQERVEKVFGEDAQSVIEEIKSGEITDNIKLLLFNELSDIQPVSIAEMPEAYAKSGNGRIFYMLKSFTIRQLDFFRNEIYEDFKSKDTALRGVRRMIKLTFFLSLFGVSVDSLKDIILGRPVNIGDAAIDNIAQYLFMSRYTLAKSKYEGIGRTLVQNILPPTKVIDYPFTDIRNMKFRKTPRTIPIGGELYYWWFGYGSEYKHRMR